ncbi:MAG: peptidoglycan-binding protein [Cyanobacteria bacterium J06626_14]
METFAFLEIAVGYEDPSPEVTLRPFAPINLELPKSSILGAAGLAAATTIFSLAPDAQAVIRRGDFCGAVGDVQRALNEQGFSVGSADDVFGARTFDAVQQFQTSRSLVADGIVGPATADALGLGDVEDSQNPFLPGNGCDVGGGSSADTSPTETPAATDSPITRVVTADSGLIVRTGSGLRFSSVGSLTSGSSVTYAPSTRASSDGLDWVQISSGPFQGRWVAESFLAEPTPTDTSDNPTDDDATTIASGNVAASPNLTIRDGAGLRFAPAGSFTSGTSVRYIAESRTDSDGLEWVQVSDGAFEGKWIAEDFLTGVVVDDDDADDGDADDGDTVSEGDGDTTNTTTGVVTTDGDPLTVRSEAGLSASIQGSVANGREIVYQTEGLRLVDGLVWVQLASGEQSGGWVAQDFVR